MDGLEVIVNLIENNNNNNTVNTTPSLYPSPVDEGSFAPKAIFVRSSLVMIEKLHHFLLS
ncbi:hypothetical protein E4U37_005785 [Claviceps purpurea]|nr:hypothetical protein E4U37_005785 [Claviceps purpurea]